MDREARPNYPYPLAFSWLIRRSPAPGMAFSTRDSVSTEADPPMFSPQTATKTKAVTLT